MQRHSHAHAAVPHDVRTADHERREAALLRLSRLTVQETEAKSPRLNSDLPVPCSGLWPRLLPAEEGRPGGKPEPRGRQAPSLPTAPQQGPRSRCLGAAESPPELPAPLPHSRPQGYNDTRRQSEADNFMQLCLD